MVKGHGVLSDGERWILLSPPGEKDTNFLRACSRGFPFAATHLSLRQRESSRPEMPEESLKWRLWGEIWGNGSGVSCAGMYLDTAAAIFFEKSKSLLGEKQLHYCVGNCLLHPRGFCSPHLYHPFFYFPPPCILMLAEETAT